MQRVRVLRVGVLALLLLGASGAAEEIRIVGSETVAPIAMEVQDWFYGSESGIEVSIESTNSEDGISALIDGTADVAMHSRPLETFEYERAVENGVYPMIYTIARRQIVVTVNPMNPIKDVSTDQLIGIWMGEITSWSELGGMDEPIVFGSRDTSSDVYEVWREAILDGAEFAGTQVSVIDSDLEMREWVANNINAIGYLNLEKTERLLAVPAGEDRIEGLRTVSIIRNEGSAPSHSIGRDLYISTNGVPNGAVAAVVEAFIGEIGQLAAESVGFIPVWTCDCDCDCDCTDSCPTGNLVNLQSERDWRDAIAAGTVSPLSSDDWERPSWDEWLDVAYPPSISGDSFREPTVTPHPSFDDEFPGIGPGIEMAWGGSDDDPNLPLVAGWVFQFNRPTNLIGTTIRVSLGVPPGITGASIVLEDDEGRLRGWRWAVAPGGLRQGINQLQLSVDADVSGPFDCCPGGDSPLAPPPPTGSFSQPGFNPTRVVRTTSTETGTGANRRNVWTRVVIPPPSDLQLATGYFARGVWECRSGNTAQAASQFQLALEVWDRVDQSTRLDIVERFTNQYLGCREGGELYSVRLATSSEAFTNIARVVGGGSVEMVLSTNWASQPGASVLNSMPAQGLVKFLCYEARIACIRRMISPYCGNPREMQAYANDFHAVLAALPQGLTGKAKAQAVYQQMMAKVAGASQAKKYFYSWMTEYAIVENYIPQCSCDMPLTDDYSGGLGTKYANSDADEVKFLHDKDAEEVSMEECGCELTP